MSSECKLCGMDAQICPGHRINHPKYMSTCSKSLTRSANECKLCGMDAQTCPGINPDNMPIYKQEPQMGPKLYSQIYHAQNESSLWTLVHKYGIFHLNSICKKHGEDHESILHIFVQMWLPELLEIGCAQLPQDINYENRLNKTPLACCFGPNDVVITEFRIARSTVLLRGMQCIKILIKYGADQKPFRHLERPFQMGSCCIDPELITLLDPPAYDDDNNSDESNLYDQPPSYDE